MGGRGWALTPSLGQIRFPKHLPGSRRRTCPSGRDLYHPAQPALALSLGFCSAKPRCLAPSRGGKC